jgi:ATP-dependent DNA helicase RecG
MSPDLRLSDLRPSTIDLIRTKYLKAAITYQGIQRIERYPIPFDALREAVLNALVHRDYAIPSPMQIRVYEDKLKIWNSIVMPEGWTLEALRDEHSSPPYNPTIANTFFRIGTRDDEAQPRRVERLMRENFSEKRPAWVSIIVLTGLSWVLARTYGYTRAQIAAFIGKLL